VRTGSTLGASSAGRRHYRRQVLRLLRSQLRRHPARYLATALAVALGAGFVAVSLLFTATLNRTLGDALTTELAGSAVVVGPPRVTAGANRVEPGLLEQLSGTPGVAAVAGLATARAQAQLPRLGTTPVTVGLVADDPRLRWQQLSAGTFPGPGQVLLDSQSAAASGIRPGDVIRVGETPPTSTPAPGSTADPPAALSVPVRVSGVVELGSGLTYSPPAVFARPADASLVGLVTGYFRVVVAGDGSVTDAVLSQRIDGRVQLWNATTGAGLVTRTLGGQRDAAIQAVSFGTDILGGFLLGFATIAVVVAGLVIANTFVVLLAQRSRELALLRCVGADRRQLLGSVLGEAATLGIVAGAAGFAGALAVTAGAVLVLNRIGLPVLVSGVQVNPGAVVAPVLVGLAVTVLAALGPARAAMRVAPVAALRPATTPATGTAAGRRRAVAGAALVLVGSVPLAVTLSRRGLAAGGGPGGVAVGIVGGVLTFAGVLLAGQLLVPAAVRVVGVGTRLLGRTPGRLAVTNALRNPARASATTSALVVGITLVTLVGTGAATTQATFLSAIETANPIDVSVTAPGLVLTGGPGGAPTATPLPSLATPRVRAVSGVGGLAASVPLRTARLTLRPATAAGGFERSRTGPVTGADLGRAAAVVRGGVLDGAHAGQLLLPPDRVGRRLRVAEGDPVRLSGPAGSRQLRVHFVAGLAVPVLVSDQDLTAVAGRSAVTTAVWGRTAALDPGGDPGRVGATVAAVQRAAVPPTPTPTPTPTAPATPTATAKPTPVRSAAAPGKPTAKRSATGPAAPSAIRATPSASTSSAASTAPSAVAAPVPPPPTIGGGALRAGRFLQILNVLLLVVTALLGVAVVIAIIGIGNTLSLSVAERRRESALLRSLGLTRTGLRLTVALEALTLSVVASGVGIGLGIGYGFAGIRALLGEAVAIRFTVPVGQILLLAVAAALAGLLASVLPARRAARIPPARGLAEE